jgi:sulfur-oxidizing protein SoxA
MAVQGLLRGATTHAITGALALSALSAHALEPLRSGFDTMSEPIQAMQRDDEANPGMLSVLQGRASWSREPAPGKPAQPR